MDEFMDPELGRMAAADEDDGCVGCTYKCGSPACRGAPPCAAEARADKRGVIWVRAADATQAPKAVRLTDEQIAQITAQTWGSVDIAPQSAAAFARAVEAAALKANNLEIPE